MNKIILTNLLIAACGISACAFAQTTSPTSTTTSTTTTQSASYDQSTGVALGTRQVPAPGDRSCIQDTGSHIKRHDQACLPVSGNSYSREELQRTGKQDIGRALQELDPSVQVTGH